TVHITDYQKGYIGLISHLGVMIEILAGVALSFQRRGEERVALVYSGDGMTSTGAFHEGFNLAAVRKAPLIVVVENNQYAYSTPTWKQTAAESFVAKAPGYGVHGEKCDGNDVLAVYEMTQRAATRARAGEGASLLEVETYRMKGHAEHDGQGYVPEGEIDAWEAKDPIKRFETRLLDEGWATRAELDALDERARAVVDEAREAAEASPMPDPLWALGETYGDRDDRRPWTRLPEPDPHSA
ncbi:MAG TPA: thiamine pyrophosphate-dependent dehydrogenase E1 component subunit alpha, partial [Longimicrobiales bacterium]|nr:thiamine pyrophosphate-dependent dehydrogenase E1 component subunit alpha [Longimicrobiales bacterium]